MWSSWMLWRTAVRQWHSPTGYGPPNWELIPLSVLSLPSATQWTIDQMDRELWCWWYLSKIILPKMTMERTSPALLFIIGSRLLSPVVTLVQNAAPNTHEANLRGRPLSMDALLEITGDEMFGINEQCSKLHSYQIAFLGGEILLVLKVISSSIRWKSWWLGFRKSPIRFAFRTKYSSFKMCWICVWI